MQMKKTIFLNNLSVHVWQLPFQKKQSSETLAIQVLQNYLPEAHQIVFERGSHGKPFLKNHTLEFNFSHSGDYFLMAVSHRPVGIDIEHMRDNKDFMAIAKRFFANQEYQMLITLPPTEQKAAFYRCWTLKEAYIKATGLGLSLGLANFEVDFLTHEKSCLVKAHDDNLWTLHSIALEFPGYYAALCVQDHYNTLQFFHHNHLPLRSE